MSETVLFWQSPMALAAILFCIFLICALGAGTCLRRRRVIPCILLLFPLCAVLWVACPAVWWASRTARPDVHAQQVIAQTTRHAVAGWADRGSHRTGHAARRSLQRALQKTDEAVQRIAAEAQIQLSWLASGVVRPGPHELREVSHAPHASNARVTIGQRGVRVSVGDAGRVFQEHGRSLGRGGILWSVVTGGLIAAFLYVAYLILDAATRGHFTWPLRLLSLVAFAVLFAAVALLRQTF